MYFNQNVIRLILGLCLDIVVAFAAVRSGLFKRLPVFTAYLVVVVSCDLLADSFRMLLGSRSTPFFTSIGPGRR